MASPSVDLEALAARALRAREEARLDLARDLYAQLEAAEPARPEWPRELATIHRLENDTQRELEALLRSADRHAAQGQFIPALATCKMILSIDPGFGDAQLLLTKLQPDQAVSVDYHADVVDDAFATGSARARHTPTAPQPPSPTKRGGRPTAPHTETLDSAALDELVLTDIVVGARPANIANAELTGVHEIPLEVVVFEPSDRKTPDRIHGAAPGSPPSGEIAAHLESSPLFASLGAAALAGLVQRVELVSLAAGEELFHQGDPAGALYIVARGAVVPVAEELPRTRLGVLEEGEFFGEIALFTDQPRNATVEALVETQLLAIDRPVMWSLIRRHPEVLSVLLGFLRDRLIDRLVRTSPLFRIFSGTKRSAIARRFQFLEVTDGHKVVEQHHPTEAVFILLSGQMEVIHEADADPSAEPASDESAPETAQVAKVLATLHPGELFGEMSLLWREPSLASVVARGKCWLLALPARSFQEMLDHHPQLAAMAATIAEERRNQNQRTLRDALGHRDGRAGII